MLSLRTQGGFANRLRAIISGVLWSEDLEVPLSVYWPVEPGHMPCALWDIFLEPSIPRMEAAHAGYLPGATEVQSVDAMKKYLEYHSGSQEYRIESYSEFHPECKSKRGLEVLRRLKFHPEILKLKEELLKQSRIEPPKGWNGKWTGFHYRGTDHTKCKAKCTPEDIKREINTVLYKSNTFPMIFLATDEHSVGKYLKEAYPSFVSMPVVVKSRAHKEGQILAIVDWLCLASCKEVYGSAGSTFSEWAALYGGATYHPLDFSATS